MDNKDKIILDLCGGTGSWGKPYLESGYDYRNITYPDYDVRTYVPPKNVYGILAAPPCTEFSIARNDTTARKPRDMRKGMEIVLACLKIIWECRYEPIRNKDNSLTFWALENPNGYLKWFLGEPKFMFHPYEFGDPYTKRTCLWGMFNKLQYNVVAPRDFMHPTTKDAKDYVSCVEHFADLKSIPDDYQDKTGYNRRTILRSMTPQGFAQAFYKANQ